MPVAVSLEMYAEKPVVLPFFTGYVSRGLLLHILRTVDPALASSLHEADRPKPYSVTPLRFKSRKKSRKGYLMDHSLPCRVRFRFLRDKLSKRLLEYFYENTSVLIYDAVFKVASLHFKSESYEDICENASEPVESFRLYFKTPTYLASLGTDFNYLYPDPTRIFPNLMRLWNLFSNNKKFTKKEYLEYKEWLSEKVGVSQHKLKTRIAFMGKKKAVGFTGWATYEIKNQNKWNKVTRILTKFAEYSNIGGNRTGGFGVTRHKTIPQGKRKTQ